MEDIKPERTIKAGDYIRLKDGRVREVSRIECACNDHDILTFWFTTGTYTTFPEKTTKISEDEYLRHKALEALYDEE